MPNVSPARGFMLDLGASFLVFLVALPLCLGIAIASGAPPEKGLITGIIGGLLTGALAGSPLQVSGPAAGLTVLVFSLVTRHGIDALAPVVVMGGLLQICAGIGRVGAWVRAIPHAVVEAMLAAIGLILAAQQCHVVLDDAPAARFLPNLLTLPAALAAGHWAALLLGGLTAVIIVVWERMRPHALRDVPGPLLGILAATALSVLCGLHVSHITLSVSLMDGISVLDPATLWRALNPNLLETALSLALIASIESLLSAAAVDAMRPGKRRADYNRELIAQGVGNVTCGMLGALPMTGVIVRSAANVRAGARTRASAIMHGIWLLGLVALLPGALGLIPTASLGGLLIVIGLRLVSLRVLRALAHQGFLSVACYGATVLAILLTNLLTGVATGVVLALCARMIPRLAREAG